MTAPLCSSTLPGRNGAPWPPWPRQSPSLVAEALERVRDPLACWLRPGPPAPPELVAARLARALLPPAAPDPPPGWLRPDQRLSFARALEAVRRRGGAILADPPGTGKTWIGLAVAVRLEPECPVHVVAPALLGNQWEAVARRVRIPIRFHSHERLSRGRAPGPEPGPVIVDESHRFRNPRTRRYLTLAPWCVGRRGILLSATPAVNRLRDTVPALLLFCPDDVLGWAGIARLSSLETLGPPEELARLIVTGEDRSAGLPRRASRPVRIGDRKGAGGGSLLARVLALRLSSDPGTAALIRISLLAALASSPAAFHASLVRYRSLLLHARDGAALGRRLTRQAIRSLAGDELDQLVLWPLVAEEAPGSELELGDLQFLPGLEAGAREAVGAIDPKCRMLESLARRPGRTLVFTGFRATVGYLRNRLGSGIAWCTGDRAGVDRLELDRDVVLDLFRTPIQPGEPGSRPRVLVATDVAAEGLDLPQITRVVHYDLPWTAVRLEQRAGRAFRLGSQAARVEVVRLLPPREVEAVLRREAILDEKRLLPGMIGLNSQRSASWRLRAEIAALWAGRPDAEGIARIEAPITGFLAGLRLVFGNGSTEELVVMHRSGRWIRDLKQIARLLGSAQPEGPGIEPAILRDAVRKVARMARERLRSIRAGRIAGNPGGAADRLRRRLMQLGRKAGARRDWARLRTIERGLRFLRRGLTAGELLEVEFWSRLPGEDLIRALSRLPEPVPVPPLERIELIGLLLGRPGKKLG